MRNQNLKVFFLVFAAVILIGNTAIGAPLNQGSVTQKGTVTTYTPSSQEIQASRNIDYRNAKPMPLPTIDTPPAGPLDGEVIEREGLPAVVPGNPGTGIVSPGAVDSSVSSDEMDALDAFESDAEVAPMEYGTSNHPFTTSRVDLVSNNESKSYPYRATGKLYFKIGTAAYVCSASLIKRGLVVTAAHCVAEYGKKTWHTNFVYVPALYNATRPYGTWTGASASAMTVYLNGTDSCAVAGVVCKNDVAVIRLNPQSGAFPGTATGWYGYGTNGYGFTAANLALINQLGYPVSHDSGLKMQRTDSQGFVSAANSSNTVWGSRQTGGSSGGPELVNLGINASLDGTTVGSEAAFNTVVGVTSWGYTDTTVKQQGASPFLTTNIPVLVNAQCGKPVTQAACK